MTQCTVCNGTGQLPLRCNDCMGVGCPKCGGKGTKGKTSCNACGGTGQKR